MVSPVVPEATSGGASRVGTGHRAEGDGAGVEITTNLWFSLTAQEEEVKEVVRSEMRSRCGKSAGEPRSGPPL